MELVHVVHAGSDVLHKATELDGDAEELLDYAEELRTAEHAVVQAGGQEVVVNLKDLWS